MKLVSANLDQMQIFVIIKPRRSEDKCRCEFKELIEKGISDKDLIRILAIANANVSNNKQRWNEGKCRYEFKELIDKEIFNKGLIRILAIANANVINHAMLENISIIITLSVEKDQLITQLKNVTKILMKKNYNRIK